MQLPSPAPSNRPRLANSGAPLAEQVLAWAMRRWSIAGGMTSEIEAALWALFGLSHFEKGLEGFDGLMRTLYKEGRRKLSFQRDRERPTPDAHAVLALVALHQHSNADHLSALLRWLAPDHAHRSLSERANRLAEALEACGYVLLPR